MIGVRTTNVEKLQKDANVYLVMQLVYMCLPGREEGKKKGFGRRPKERKRAERDGEEDLEERVMHNNIFATCFSRSGGAQRWGQVAAG